MSYFQGISVDDDLSFGSGQSHTQGGERGRGGLTEVKLFAMKNDAHSNHHPLEGVIYDQAAATLSECIRTIELFEPGPFTYPHIHQNIQ